MLLLIEIYLIELSYLTNIFFEVLMHNVVDVQYF